MSFLHSGRRARPMQAQRLNRSRPQPMAATLHSGLAGGLFMRLLTIAVLAIGMAVSACDRASAVANASAAAATSTTTPALAADAPRAARPAPRAAAPPAAAVATHNASAAAVREVTLPAGTRLP